MPLGSRAPDPQPSPALHLPSAGLGSHHAAVISRWQLTRNNKTTNDRVCVCAWNRKKTPSVEKCLLSARNWFRAESRTEPGPRRSRSRPPGYCSHRPSSSSWTRPKRSIWSGEFAKSPAPPDSIQKTSDFKSPRRSSLVARRSSLYFFEVTTNKEAACNVGALDLEPSPLTRMRFWTVGRSASVVFLEGPIDCQQLRFQREFAAMIPARRSSSTCDLDSG